MTQLTSGIKPEWSYEVLAEKITEKPYKVHFKASDQECKDIARRLDVTGIDHLEATVILTRERGSIRIHAEGLVICDVTQECVVSLGAVNTHIEGDFEAWFADDADVVSLDAVRQKKKNSVFDSEQKIPDEKEDPEPIVDGRIELGEIVIQNIALALNPYPHAEGAVYKDICEHPDAASRKEARHKPFAGLKEWKAQKEKDTK